MKRYVIAVDFDGPIHPYSKGWHDGTLYDPIRPEAVAALRKFRENGWSAVIHTSRGCDFISHENGVGTDWDQIEAVRAYLDAAGAPYDAVIPKFTADAYIDDRAVLCDPNLGMDWDGVKGLFRWERGARRDDQDPYAAVIVWSRSDEAFLCLVPGFPGFAVFGSSRMDALACMESALPILIGALRAKHETVPVCQSVAGFMDPLAKKIQAGLA